MYSYEERMRAGGDPNVPEQWQKVPKRQFLTVCVRICLHMKTYCDIILPSAEGGLYYGKYIDSVPDG